MSQLVLDASVTTGWLLEDERDPYSVAVLATVIREGAVVPQHWRLEVANALLFAERRNRLLSGEAKRRLLTLNDLSIQVDVTCDFASGFDLASEHGLTFYDAVYLELAQRRRLLLATLDGDLASAARRSGVPLFND